MSAIVLSFFAGALSVLSPCVLPVLPVIVASALHRHEHGPLALAAGLVASSTAVGLFFASLGFTIGVDRDVVRAVSGGVMALVGAALLVPRLQARFEGVLVRIVAPIAQGAEALTARLPATLLGQFVLGTLVGTVWVPCTGPTLAAALALAAHGETFAYAGVVMFIFGIGAVVPVLILAYGSRRTLASASRALTAVGSIGKAIMGVALLLVGALTVTGADKRLETWMVDHMPPWLLEITTRF